MNDWTKGDGARIKISFTEPLVGGVSGAAGAFTVTVPEYTYVPGGELAEVVKKVAGVELSDGEIWEDVKRQRLYENRDGYIRYADHTYNTAGIAGGSSTNAVAVFSVQPGEVFRVGLRMLSRFRVGTLAELVNKSIVQGLYIEPRDQNDATVTDEDVSVVYTVGEGQNFLLVGYWTSGAGAWADTFETLTLERLAGTGEGRAVILTMEPLERFESAAGDISVSYDGTGGLMGDGGLVEPFTASFMPEGLVPKPDQNDAEHIEISGITASGTLTRIYYSDAQGGGEHIEIAGITATGVLTHVDDI